MIIPIKCFTCGEVLADKYRYYLEQVKSKKMKRGIQSDTVLYLTKNTNHHIELKNVKKKIIKAFDTNKKKIVFIGNFYENTFDFEILNELKVFISKNKTFKFLIFGDGPAKFKIKKKLKFNNINFYDPVNKDEKKFILKDSHAFFIPIINRQDLLKSLPNKVIDSIQYKL